MFHKNQIWNKPNSFYRVRTAWADAKKIGFLTSQKNCPLLTGQNTSAWAVIRLLGFRCAYISNEDTKHKEYSGSLGALPNTGGHRIKTGLLRQTGSLNPE